MRGPVAQLVEHQVAMWQVVSLTPAGPTLRVLNNWGESAAFVITSAGFSNLAGAPGASHWLLQAFAPGTFHIPNFTNYTILFP